MAERLNEEQRRQIIGLRQELFDRLQIFNRMIDQGGFLLATPIYGQRAALNRAHVQGIIYGLSFVLGEVEDKRILESPAPSDLIGSEAEENFLHEIERLRLLSMERQ